MSVTQSKRPLPMKIQKMKARKRQKLEQGEASEQSPTTKTSKIDAEKPVNLNDLEWKQVDVPENMDDYGGFYGLEEIDDVEVIRDELGAKATFKLTKKPRTKKNLSRNNNDESLQNASSHKLDIPSNSEEEEWAGFEDEPVQTEVQHEQSQKSSVTPKNQNHEKKKDSKQSSKLDSKGDALSKASGSNDMGFSVLEDLDESKNADVSAWKAVGLSPEILGSLSRLGFSRPTQIQSSAIPRIRDGHDLIGKAPTGSGKTLAFGIPILEEILASHQGIRKKDGKQISALVILPTRELAHQIGDHLQSLISYAELDDVTVAAITGGLSIYKQRRLLTQANIVVGTPGRLWEVITEGQGVLESLKFIKFLVIDEADRLLSDGHFKELEEILSALDKEVTNDSEIDASAPAPLKPSAIRQDRQTLVFSATFSKSLQQSLSKRTGFHASNPFDSESDTMAYFLRKLNFRSEKPAFIDVNPVQQMAENLREGFVECPAGTEKDLYLYTLLLYHHPGARALVFVNSISAAKRLVPFLNNLGLLTYPLQSQMPQKARLRSVERFSSLVSKNTQPENGKQIHSQPKESKILVATDVAARGLDIPNISLVLHYHVPRTADMYVHRSGRTARASNSGSSILLCAPEEVAGVRRLVAQVHSQHSSSSPSTNENTRSSGGKTSGRSKYLMQALQPDSRLVNKLKPRVVLAQKIADSVVVKEKKRKENEFFRAAAEELGVSSDDMPSDDEGNNDEMPKQKNGRGTTRFGNEEKGKGAKKRMESLSVSQDEMKAMRAELKGLLGSKINIGVSEKYFVSQGGERVERLLRERESGAMEGTTVMIDGAGILGAVDGLGWDA